ncbi:MAG TPA: Ig-like domain-containing protein [Longimicrobiales bacterium]|nr:Ig-like domain-containing protein [Longimicrobiales bacterium]
MHQGRAGRVALLVAAAMLSSGATCEILSLSTTGEIRVAINPDRLTLAVGDTVTLHYSAPGFSGGTLQSRFESANPEIASIVAPDRVTGRRVGRTTVTLVVSTADDRSGSDRIPVTVVAAE